jgi:hypothetical protein
VIYLCSCGSALMAPSGSASTCSSIRAMKQAAQRMRHEQITLCSNKVTMSLMCGRWLDTEILGKYVALEVVLRAWLDTERLTC